jgi:ADP-specific Phosphofructokinase/Glucokinase conserved region
VQSRWRDSYAGLLGRLGLYGQRANWTVCGLSVCVDAFAQLADCVELFAAGPPQARSLGAELYRRAAAGIGGEIRVDWAEGPQWVDANLPVRAALGGTSAHAARLLTMLGAPALLALEHRGPEQLRLLGPDMLLAEGDRAVRARDVATQGEDRPRVYVFEFTAGEPVAGITPPRSSRIIVRFHDLALQYDAAFERLSPRLIGTRPGFGAGVVSGFNALGAGPALETGLRYARQLAQSWTDAGIGIIHLELAGYETAQCRDTALDRLAGAVTSIGMSLSEFEAIELGSQPLAEAMRQLGERLAVDRVCVHADDWAMSATRRDPAQEREALMAGCLLAGARAASGALCVPQALPEGAHFGTPPAEETEDGWHIVSCPSPHLERPRTTLGLGDTFMAGCLLVLGQERLVEESVSRAEAPAPSWGRNAHGQATVFSMPRDDV